MLSHKERKKHIDDVFFSHKITLEYLSETFQYLIDLSKTQSQAYLGKLISVGDPNQILTSEQVAKIFHTQKTKNLSGFVKETLPNIPKDFLDRWLREYGFQVLSFENNLLYEEVYGKEGAKIDISKLPSLQVSDYLSAVKITKNTLHKTAMDEKVGQYTSAKIVKLVIKKLIENKHLLVKSKISDDLSKERFLTIPALYFYEALIFLIPRENNVSFLSMISGLVVMLYKHRAIKNTSEYQTKALEDYLKIWI